ncbi:DNA-binding Lrp family transcriptional regulator [Acidovorax sp. 62]|uniref:siroheme decarboxylase subunit beta n=1 Tax=Acidovorax sp. 62 TaxID=2035203 RepID=UPI000C42860B|nr:Lrp/AsnC family transcriptional regulator [Acidovorax sp. 62]PIF92354.1 DNA-binding Lrp family transcriptional regulator [Acidovorax sp. 62]
MQAVPDPAVPSQGSPSPSSSSHPSPAQRLSLLNAWQRGFPLCDEPFAVVGAALGMPSAQVLQAYRQLAQEGALSRIGAVFAPGSGGASVLAAMAVPPDRLETVAAVVSAHPGVNHNYERENTYNLWFVLTGASEVQVEQAMVALEAATGLSALRLPMLQPYRIDLAFDLAAGLTAGTCIGSVAVGSAALPASQAPHGPRAAATAVLADADWPLAALAEAGLPLVEQPYAAWAQALGTTAAQVQARLQQWVHTGVLSRFGVVVRHHELGFAANAMTVLDVPDAQVDAAGRALAAQPGVTLAYRRARATGWPYNLYFMVHGAHRQAVEQVLASALERSGLAAVPRAVLFSRRRFKQTGGRRFGSATPVAPQGVVQEVADAVH